MNLVHYGAHNLVNGPKMADLRRLNLNFVRIKFLNLSNIILILSNLLRYEVMFTEPNSNKCLSELKCTCNPPVLKVGGALTNMAQKF